MSKLTSITCERVLAIPENAPEKLFSGNLSVAKSEYRMLGLYWHPDRNSDPESLRVFQHITALYKNAKALLETGSWRGAGVLELEGNGRNKSRRIPYSRVAPFELGELYLGAREIVFAVRRQYGDLFENARKHINAFYYADAAMRREIERCLPPEPKCYVTGEGFLMVVPKSPDLILLDDLRDYLGGEIAPRHVGWIQNTIHNLSCYFEFAGITHHDISPNTYFVSPVSHSGALLGGWWYACRTGEKLKALPRRTIRTAPPDVIRGKKADSRTDLELIRATGRELLGDANGANLKARAKIPAPFVRWLTGATTGEAVLDYELWREVLRESFGAPRFIRLSVDAAEIYPPAEAAAEPSTRTVRRRFLVTEL